LHRARGDLKPYNRIIVRSDTHIWLLSRHLVLNVLVGYLLPLLVSHNQVVVSGWSLLARMGKNLPPTHVAFPPAFLRALRQGSRCRVESARPNYFRHDASTVEAPAGTEALSSGEGVSSDGGGGGVGGGDGTSSEAAPAAPVEKEKTKTHETTSILTQRAVSPTARRLRVAMHVQRGDVDEHNKHYVPDEYFFDIENRIRHLG